jgi:hypothetical protein
VTHSIDMPYDSEMKAAYALERELRERFQEERMNPQDFVDLVKERFGKIGLLVDVKTWTTGNVVGQHPLTGEDMVEEVSGLYTFEIEIMGRVDKHEFDYDKMRHEVQTNLLGIPGGGGVIKEESNLDEIVKRYTKGHQH